MTYAPYAYLYGGATCEDLYTEQDNPTYAQDLGYMASPRCAFVALEYSEQLIEELARDMWDEIAELYEPGTTFEDLRTVASSSVAERPEGFEGPLPVKEVIMIEYYLAQTIEPLIKIVVQIRPARLPNNRK